MAAPSEVVIVEVAARDGLQNEPGVLSPAQRAGFIDALAASGLSVIEAGSFVSPKWVPQMAGSAEVLARIAPRPFVSYPVLTPNLQGLEDALSAGADAVSIFVSASETFSRKNTNCSIDEAMARGRQVVARATEAGVPVRGYLSCALGSPFGDVVTPRAVIDLAASLVEIGCVEVSVSDTTGRGTAGAARDVVSGVISAIGVDRTAIHFHDTYGQGLANVLACLELGVRTIDASAGGLGGCPYAPGAGGNLATEDVLYMLEGLGVRTGVDMERLLDAVALSAEQLGVTPRSKVFTARRGAPTRKADIAA